MKKVMYSSMHLIGSSFSFILKSLNNSSFNQPLIDSIAQLSVGVPARDIECVILYKGKSSLKLFEEYTDP